MPLAGNAAGGVAATSLALGMAGVARGGFSVNHMDIAPRHAGVFMGLSNTAGTVAGAPWKFWYLYCQPHTKTLLNPA
jgi:ACS family sodium-dependent inorganic phosphate cotransporter